MGEEKGINLSDNEDEDELDEELGEVIESAPPLKVGEERELNNSGLKQKLLKQGRGWETPEFNDEVTVTMWAPYMLEPNSILPEISVTLKLGRVEVVAGLDHGIITMKKGERALFTVPPELGYGVMGCEAVPPNSAVQFDVELVSWITVVNVTKDSGIVKKIMEKGQSMECPGDLDEALVKYEVALSDGAIVLKTPEEGIEFCVKDGHLCATLSKAIVTMRRGEKVKLIVQSKYAFGDKGKDVGNGIHLVPPNAVLNIDLELVSFMSVVDVTVDAKVLKKI